MEGPTWLRSWWPISASRRRDMVASLMLVNFAVQKLTLPESWWSTERYGWVGGDSAPSDLFAVLSLVVSVLLLMPFLESHPAPAIYFVRPVVRLIGGCTLFVLAGLTITHTLANHQAAPVSCALMIYTLFYLVAVVQSEEWFRREGWHA